jgi:ribonuclease III family protein
MENDILRCLQDSLIKDSFEIREISPLVLAYIGDAVYEVFVRTYLITKANLNVNTYHKQSVGYVKAKAQADVLKFLMDSLTTEELDIVRRGRNAKSATMPKNSEVIDYRYATAFESLIGFLYLKKDNDRLMELLNKVIEFKQGIAEK